MRNQLPQINTDLVHTVKNFSSPIKGVEVGAVTGITVFSAGLGTCIPIIGTGLGALFGFGVATYCCVCARKSYKNSLIQEIKSLKQNDLQLSGLYNYFQGFLQHINERFQILTQNIEHLRNNVNAFELLTKNDNTQDKELIQKYERWITDHLPKMKDEIEYITKAMNDETNQFNGLVHKILRQRGSFFMHDKNRINDYISIHTDKLKKLQFQVRQIPGYTEHMIKQFSKEVLESIVQNKELTPQEMEQFTIGDLKDMIRIFTPKDGEPEPKIIAQLKAALEAAQAEKEKEKTIKPIEAGQDSLQWNQNIKNIMKATDLEKENRLELSDKNMTKPTQNVKKIFGLFTTDAKKQGGKILEELVKQSNKYEKQFKKVEKKVEDKRKLASKGKIKEKIKRANSDNPNILAVPSLKR